MDTKDYILDGVRHRRRGFQTEHQPFGRPSQREPASREGNGHRECGGENEKTAEAASGQGRSATRAPPVRNSDATRRLLVARGNGTRGRPLRTGDTIRQSGRAWDTRTIAPGRGHDPGFAGANAGHVPTPPRGVISLLRGSAASALRWCPCCLGVCLRPIPFLRWSLFVFVVDSGPARPSTLIPVLTSCPVSYTHLTLPTN